MSIRYYKECQACWMHGWYKNDEQPCPRCGAKHDAVSAPTGRTVLEILLMMFIIGMIFKSITLL